MEKNKEQDYVMFKELFNKITREAGRISENNGWHEPGTDRSITTLILLMHAELSEAVEALREGNPRSKKIPEYSSVEEELADVIIRIMDAAVEFGYDISGAIIDKMIFNTTRPPRSGGKKF